MLPEHSSTHMLGASSGRRHTEVVNKVPEQARGLETLQGGLRAAVGEMMAPLFTSCNHSWVPAICEFFDMKCWLVIPDTECESVHVLSLALPASGFRGTPLCPP